MQSPTQVTRVFRSFAFLDISGFTHFTDTEGDAQAVNALADFRLVVREVASHHGVRVDKWLGDGAMFIGVQTTPLIEAIVDISRRLNESTFPLGLRAGISSGMVILFEGDDYIGTPVNLAARLCGAAGQGEILVTQKVAELAPPGVVRSDKGNVEVRGLADAVAIVSLRL